MVFQNKGSIYYMTLERLGVLKLRLSMGYVDLKNEVYELTFDI
jgi:hypothetical protein